MEMGNLKTPMVKETVPLGQVQRGMNPDLFPSCIARATTSHGTLESEGASGFIMPTTRFPL